MSQDLAVAVSCVFVYGDRTVGLVELHLLWLLRVGAHTSIITGTVGIVQIAERWIAAVAPLFTGGAEQAEED